MIETKKLECPWLGSEKTLEFVVEFLRHGGQDLGCCKHGGEIVAVEGICHKAERDIVKGCIAWVVG